MIPLRVQAPLIVAMLVAAGCATSPSPRYYTLQAPVARAPAAADLPNLAVAVGPVGIPGVVDRPEIVVTIGSNEVWPDEYNRWAAPLGDGIGLALVEQLVAQAGTPRVALAAQTALEAPDIRVAVDVQRFESVPGSHALIDAVWAVRRTRDGASEGGRATFREPAADKGYDTLAAAPGRALALVATDLARAVRKVAAAPQAAAPVKAAGSSPPR
jgi:hypothetical protein